MPYTNPIISGMNPDPSVCKVGRDYYLVTSTFEYFPGIPIYHSRDLVNWKHIGNAVERMEQLPFNKAKSSGGIWAPTIRHYNDRFYITAAFDGMGNFIISSDRPETGWSNPVWVEMDGIDPSMFFENGKMYYCANDCGSRGGNGEGISLAEVDCKTGKVIGKVKRIWNGTGGGFLEAPHIYHIGEYYYLLAAEGGTGFNHMVTEARSKGIWGQYESYPENPILTNRNDVTKMILCCGHADLTEGAEGRLWLVHLGTRPANGTMSHLGRETFLTPAYMENGWIIAQNKKAVLNPNAEIGTEQKLKNNITVNFTKTEWENGWLFIRNRNDDNYERGNGYLKLTTSKTKLTDTQGQPTFAAMRQLDFECTIQTEIELCSRNIDTETGLALYLNEKYMYKMCMRSEKDGLYLVIEKRADDFLQVAYKEKIETNRIQFTIRASKEKYDFYYTPLQGSEIFASSASTRFLSCEVAEKCFTGTTAGVYIEGKCEEIAKIYEFSMEK